MNLRLFLDANILFTAAYSPEGMSALLFELSHRRVVKLLTSEQAVEEARVNLQLKRPIALKRLAELVNSCELISAPAEAPVALKLPDDDQAIFGAALAGHATHLITGDKKHFGRYFNKPAGTGGVHIQTIRQFFDQRF